MATVQTISIPVPIPIPIPISMKKHGSPGQVFQATIASAPGRRAIADA